MQNYAHFRALTLGLVYLFFLIMQLFTFESFPGVFTDYNTPFVVASTAFTVTLLELAALPALFSMRMSKLAWQLSRLSIVLVALVWLALALAGSIAGYDGNTGLFGATVESLHGWWFLTFVSLIALTSVIVALEVPHRPSR